MPMLIFLGFCCALLAVKYILARRLTKRQAAVVDDLMRQSAVFVVRWPGQRLFDAPYLELLAEVYRCRSIIGLLGWWRPLGYRRAAAGRAEKRYYTSQIPAVQGWLDTVGHALYAAAAREGRIGADGTAQLCTDDQLWLLSTTFAAVSTDGGH